MYSEPKFEIIELSPEDDVLTESNKWNVKDEIIVDGELEFQ